MSLRRTIMRNIAKNDIRKRAITRTDARSTTSFQPIPSDLCSHTSGRIMLGG